MFTPSERQAVGKLIVAAERVLTETDVNTPAQVWACRELHSILLAVKAVIDDSRDRRPDATPGGAS